MESDWTVACGADDPIVVLPWNNANRSLRYIDLRAASKAIDQIPEARKYPSLAAALRRWNQADTPLFTAKCDVWNYPADLFDAEDLPGFAHAHGSYIDLLPTEPGIFLNFANCEKLLRAGSEIVRRIPLAAVRCEWTLRPARIFSGAASAFAVPLDAESTDGFAITLYVWGYGASPAAAEAVWCAALSALIEPVILTLGRR